MTERKRSGIETGAGAARALCAAGAGAALAALAGCGTFNETLAQPNSRAMTLAALTQAVVPGQTPQEVIARVGRPAYTFPVGWQNLSVWNYRFARPEGDCVVFQVSISNATGRVTETGQGPDPACDGPNRS